MRNLRIWLFDWLDGLGDDHLIIGVGQEFSGSADLFIYKNVEASLFISTKPSTNLFISRILKANLFIFSLISPSFWYCQILQQDGKQNYSQVYPCLGNYQSLDVHTN